MKLFFFKKKVPVYILLTALILTLCVPIVLGFEDSTPVLSLMEDGRYLISDGTVIDVPEGVNALEYFFNEVQLQNEMEPEPVVDSLPLATKLMSPVTRNYLIEEFDCPYNIGRTTVMDSDGNLWFTLYESATREYSFVKFDVQTEEWEKYSYDINYFGYSISNSYFDVDSQGHLWCLGNKLVSSTYYVVLIEYDPINSAYSEHAFAVYYYPWLQYISIDDNDVVWVPNNNPYTSSDSRRAVYSYDSTTNVVKTYLTPFSCNIGEAKFDNYGTPWIRVWNRGNIFKVNIYSTTLQSYQYAAQYLGMRQWCFDQNNDIWMTLDNAHLLGYDYEHPFFHYSFSTNNLVHHNVVLPSCTALELDDEGLLWIADYREKSIRIYDGTAIIHTIPNMQYIVLNGIDDSMWVYNYATFTVNKVTRDGTAPTTTIIADGTSGNDNWYNSAVQVSFEAVDFVDNGDSGLIYLTTYSLDGTNWIDYYIYNEYGPVPFVINTEGTTTVSYYSVDKVGNTEEVQSMDITIDFTSPETTHSLTGELGENGWYTSEVTVSLTALDSLSGVLETYYRVDGAEYLAGTSLVVTAPGEHTVEYYSVDLAGNTENVKTPIVKINNPPIADAGGPYEGFEGTPLILVNNSYDLDGYIAVYQWDLDGDGEYDDSTAANPTLMFLDDTSLTIGLLVIDDLGVEDTCTTTVTILNLAPVVEAGDDVEINEADTVVFAGKFTDAGTSDIHTISWDFGDGNTQIETLNPSHCYVDDGIYTVTLTVTDDDGGACTDTLTVTVVNTAPVLNKITAPVDPVQVNSEITATTTFTDSGVLDIHNAVWSWGDETSSAGVITEENGAGEITGKHSYESAGIYTVTLTIEDDDGASDFAEFCYVVVYDPSEGFVTGGGWINSPAGAYALDPELTGKATFGFVSKYKKGATVPTGNTEFIFHAGNLEFHSTSYDWLVIAGNNAKYKGTGTIKGFEGEFAFMLTATDGDSKDNPDLFRIKIWNKATGEVIYDNRMDLENDQYGGTALNGGSIIVHKSK